jgi:hypothetical protein
MGTDEDSATDSATDGDNNELVIPTPADLHEEHAAWEAAVRRQGVRETITDIISDLRRQSKDRRSATYRIQRGWATDVAAAFKARGWRVSIRDVPAEVGIAPRSVVVVSEDCPECDGTGVRGVQPCAACAATWGTTSGTPGSTAP